MGLPVLHEIAHEYTQALVELTDIEDDAVVDTLDSLKGTLEAKSENVIKYTQNLDATIDAMKQAEKAMSERRKKLERRSTSIKEYVKKVMSKNGITKIETVHFDLSVKKNPPKIVVDDYSLVPTIYFKQRVAETFERDKAKKALQKGEEIEGIRLVQETRLDIK